MALVAETITGAGQLTALPDGFTPEAMRQKRFNVEWQGYDREEVHAFLSQLGRELQERLDKEQRSAHVEPTIIAEAPAEPAIDLTTQLFLPPTLKADLAQAATSGVYEGAFVEVEGNRTPVVFFAADKLVSAILSGVDEFGVQAFANAIIVDHLSFLPADLLASGCGRPHRFPRRQLPARARTSARVSRTSMRSAFPKSGW